MPSLTKGRRTPLGLTYEDVSPSNSIGGRSDDESRKYLISSDPAADEIVLLDLTAKARFGLKGRGSGDWLKSRGLQLPEQVNTMVSTKDALDVVRLGAEDFLVLVRPGAQPNSLLVLRKDWEADTGSPKGFNAWRDEVWAWFHISGRRVPAFLAKTCPVDLDVAHFQKWSVAQTRAAQTDCIIVRSDRIEAPGFDLFFDIASSDFMLESLKELA